MGLLLRGVKFRTSNALAAVSTQQIYYEQGDTKQMVTATATK